MATWYQLKNFKCPVEGCTSQVAYDWVCLTDRTAVYIAQTGTMRCSNSPRHTGQLCNWRFYCGHQHGAAHYMEADTEHFTFALSAAVQLIDRAGSYWVSQLVLNIGRQYERYQAGTTHDALATAAAGN